MNRENIPPDSIDSKSVVSATASPHKSERSPLKNQSPLTVSSVLVGSKKPLGSPVDLNNSAQWRERNVIITSHQHEENAAIAQNIVEDLVDNLPCFESSPVAQSPKESDTKTSTSSSIDELDEFSECVEKTSQLEPVELPIDDIPLDPATLSPDSLLHLAEQSLSLPTDLTQNEAHKILDSIPQLEKNAKTPEVSAQLQKLSQEINQLLGRPLDEFVVDSKSEPASPQVPFNSPSDGAVLNNPDEIVVLNDLPEESFLKSDLEKSFLAEASYKSGSERSFLEEASSKFDSAISFGEKFDAKVETSSNEKAIVEDVTLKFGTENFVAIQEAVLDKASDDSDIQLSPQQHIFNKELLLNKPAICSVEYTAPQEPLDKTNLSEDELNVQERSCIVAPLEAVVQEQYLETSEVVVPEEPATQEGYLNKSVVVPEESTFHEYLGEPVAIVPEEVSVHKEFLDKPVAIVPEEVSVHKEFLDKPVAIVPEEASVHKEFLDKPVAIVPEEASVHKEFLDKPVAIVPEEVSVHEEFLDKPVAIVQEVPVVHKEFLDEPVAVVQEVPVVHKEFLDKPVAVVPEEATLQEKPLDKSVVLVPEEATLQEKPLDKSVVLVPEEATLQEKPLDKSVVLVPEEATLREKPLDEPVAIVPEEPVVHKEFFDKPVAIVQEEPALQEKALDKLVAVVPEEPAVHEESLDKPVAVVPEEPAVHEESLDKPVAVVPEEPAVHEESLDKPVAVVPEEPAVHEESLDKPVAVVPEEPAVHEESLDKPVAVVPEEPAVHEESLDKSVAIVLEKTLDKSVSAPAEQEAIVQEDSLDKQSSVLQEALALVHEESEYRSVSKETIVKCKSLDESVSSAPEPLVKEEILENSPDKAFESAEAPDLQRVKKEQPVLPQDLPTDQVIAVEETVCENLELTESPVNKSTAIEDHFKLVTDRHVCHTKSHNPVENDSVPVDVPNTASPSFLNKPTSPQIEESIIDSSQPSLVDSSFETSVLQEDTSDCQPISSKTNFQEVPLQEAIDSTAPMPTPVADADKEYEENGTSSPVDTDYVNDNVQNNSFLISGDKPKMEFDENINPFETKCNLGSHPKGENNQNIIAKTNFESTTTTADSEMLNSTSPCQNASPVPITTESGEDIERQRNLEEDEGVTFDSEKENFVSVATPFEDYAENLDSGICDHIETKCDGKTEVDVGVAAVNRRTFRKSTPSLPVDSLPGSPSHNLIHETLSGTSSPDLSFGASAPLINHSEAGPEVAQFTEDEFRSAAEVFKDPADFDFLLRAGSSKVLKESTLSRLSLYVKFDPLVKKEASPPGKDSAAAAECLKEPEIPRSKDSGTPDQKTDSLDNTAKEGRKNLNSSKLIEFESPRNVKAEKTPPKMVPVEPVQRLGDNQTEPGKFFTEEDMKKALQIHDLLYQERLLKKEKEGCEKEKSFKAEIAELQRHVKLQAECLSCTRKLLHETTRMSKLWREKKEQDRVEQTKERDQALEDLQSVETAFGDLHKRYEKTKAILEGYKQKENELRQELLDCREKLQNQEQMYEALRTRTEEQLDSANVEIENAKKSGSSELAVLSAQLKKSEMKVASLERTLVQKEQEYEELSRVYDDLIARFESQRT